jgi:hypothetical protein
MNEPAGLPPVASPTKTNPWIIILVVVIVLCCLCFGVVGLIFAFGDSILQELGLYALLPVLSILS